MDNKELVETIKRPIRHYRIQLWGYGGESAYLGLTKEQYDYWEQRKQDDHEDILLDYMLDEDRTVVKDVPIEVDFLADPTDITSARYPWYDAPGELEHQSGVDYDSAKITITEIDSEEYNATTIEDVVDGEELNKWIESLQVEDEYATELVEYGLSEFEDWAAPYILQFYSREKGTFFDGIFTTSGRFNPMKLKVFTSEYANGDDTVESIQYDGEEIENLGADSNGKGYSVHTWVNE